MYKKGQDFLYDNLMQILKSESEVLFDAWSDAYSLHCDPKILWRYIHILPKIVAAIETNHAQTNTLLVLKQFLYFFKGLLRYEKSDEISNCFELDYFTVNNSNKEEEKFTIEPSMQKATMIPCSFSFKQHAICVKAIFKLAPAPAYYSAMLSLKDEKHQVNLIFTQEKPSNEVEYIRWDYNRSIVVPLPSPQELKQDWIRFRIIFSTVDWIK